MSSIWLVALFCVGTECTMHQERLLPEVGYSQCLFKAQERLVYLMTLYPTMDLHGWRCERRYAIAEPIVPDGGP